MWLAMEDILHSGFPRKDDLTDLLNFYFLGAMTLKCIRWKSLFSSSLGVPNLFAHLGLTPIPWLEQVIASIWAIFESLREHRKHWERSD